MIQLFTKKALAPQTILLNYLLGIGRADTYMHAVIDSDPLFWYRLTENLPPAGTPRTLVADFSNAVNFANTIGVVREAAGIVNNSELTSYDFDGVDDRVQFSGFEQLKDRFSHEVWVHPTALAGPSNIFIGSLSSVALAVAPTSKFGTRQLGVSVADTFLLNLITQAGEATLFVASIPGGLASLINVTSHIVVTFEKEKAQFYLNGQPLDTDFLFDPVDVSNLADSESEGSSYPK